MAEGRAFPVGTGVPYAVFADALTPVVEELDPESLKVLTRGTEEELAFLIPALGPPDRAAALLSTERSLVSLGVAEAHDLSPLGPDDTLELLAHAFDAPEQVTESFGRVLYDWTRGNPFFLVEILKDLVNNGRLRKEGEVWVGWETRDLELPGTVRETLEARVARIAAVMGARVRHDALRSVSELGDEELLEALDELRREQLLQERDGEKAIRVGEAGLAIAEKVGYLVWGIHRLLPVIAEAYLELRDLEGARKTGDRLRRYSERMGHRLGLAWADACDALVAWLDGEPERKSNKAIGKELEISPRTVSTHLSNIYRKLDVSSRGELTDRVREGVWPRE